jgi:hypothetical protein
MNTRRSICPKRCRVHHRLARTFAMNVSQTYDGEVEMDGPVELKTELEVPSE